MLICFHATPDAKSALDSILATGHFRDISEAISLALVNYNVLSQTVSEGGQIFPAGAPAQATPFVVKGQGTATAPSSSASSPRTGSIEVPEAFNLRATTLSGIKLVEPPPPSAQELAGLGPAKWLFGQFNKFLAPKATCRALFNLMLESPSGIPVEEAVKKISYAACHLGDYLQHLDQRQQSRREDAFASAFPSSALEGGGESRLRFGNQFVANIRQDQLGGFPAALRFVVMDGSKEPRLALTKAGAEFAILENPVLDGGGTPPTRKLSQAEVSFLLDHIIRSVPEETSAYKAILDALESGANTPDTVDKYLRQRFGLPAEKDITKTFLTTQRTGAISRLVDLGLIARVKEGLRVTYLITQEGGSFQKHLKKKKDQ